MIDFYIQLMNSYVKFLTKKCSNVIFNFVSLKSLNIGNNVLSFLEILTKIEGRKIKLGISFYQILKIILWKCM